MRAVTNPIPFLVPLQHGQIPRHSSLDTLAPLLYLNSRRNFALLREPTLTVGIRLDSHIMTIPALFILSEAKMFKSYSSRIEAITDLKASYNNGRHYAYASDAKSRSQ